jgi:hypothetical protein
MGPPIGIVLIWFLKPAAAASANQQAIKQRWGLKAEVRTNQPMPEGSVNRITNFLPFSAPPVSQRPRAHPTGFCRLIPAKPCL